MGWKGTMRTMGATMRQIERENERSRKAQEKQNALIDASNTVEEYNNYIYEITNLHKVCFSNLNWKEISEQPCPVEPKKQEVRQSKIKTKIEAYVPNKIEKILKIDKVRKTLLKKSLEFGIQKDKEEYSNNLRQYEYDKNEWDINQKISKKLLSHKTEHYIEFLEEAAVFDDIDYLANNISFSSTDNDVLEVIANINTSDEMIPDEEHSLRQTGSLATKKMAKSKGLEIYQDYTCSSLMRVAREIFGLVPLNDIRLNCAVDMLNTSTGHIEKQVILSIYFPKENLEKINWDYIDPSDALSNFSHNIKFTKSGGFKPVEKISIPLS